MKIKNGLKWWIVGLVAGVLGLLVFLWYFVIGIQAGYDGLHYNKQLDAIWLGHEWVDQKKSDAEILALAQKLANHNINTIFVHIGPIEENGKISSDKFPEVMNFVEKMHSYLPEEKILAWMGQLRNKINLGDPGVRRGIVSMATLFVDVVGMDGVHYDIEPVWDEDQDFIQLLAETKDKIGAGEGKILSVALAEFIPSSFVWWTQNILDLKNYNTETNYLNVAEHANQIVDMVYDTGIDSSWAYRWFIKEQIVWVTSLMKDRGGVEFLIGIPAYDEKNDFFDPKVENIENALSGIINGLNDIRSEDEYFHGIAIYPEWEMSQEEWSVFDALWSGFKGEDEDENADGNVRLFLNQ